MISQLFRDPSSKLAFGDARASSGASAANRPFPISESSLSFKNTSISRSKCHAWESPQLGRKFHLQWRYHHRSLPTRYARWLRLPLATIDIRDPIRNVFQRNEPGKDA